MGMRSSLFSVLAVACLAGGLLRPRPRTKVAVISVQGAIVGTKDGQKAAQELEAKFAPSGRTSTSAGRNHRFAGSAPQGQQYHEPRTSGPQLERDIDEKTKRLNRDEQDANEELNTEQQKLLQSLGQRMMAVIEKYAKDNGYSMVLDVSNPNTPVLYASSAIDITQDIISLYDKTSTNGGPASGPQTPGTTTPGAITPRTTAPGAGTGASGFGSGAGGASRGIGSPAGSPAPRPGTTPAEEIDSHSRAASLSGGRI